LLFFEDLR